MAQETIRVNCVESVYLGEDKPDGNYGKTPELKLEHQKTSKEHLKYFAILQFDVPEKVKKHKILSCKLNFNATVYATTDPFLDRQETHFNFFSLNPEHQSIAADIYSSQYEDIAYSHGGAYIKVGKKTSAGYKELMLTQIYPNYTDFSFDYLRVTNYSGPFTAEYLWSNFVHFLENGIAFVLNECDTSLTGMYSQVTMQSSRTSKPPYMEITIDTDYLYLEATSTGFVDPSKDFRFEWKIAPTLHLYNPMTSQSSAQFRIRKKGEEETQTTDISGATAFHIIPANTLEASAYEWQVSVTTDDGRTATTEWQEFTTVDGTSSAKIIRPNLITLDGSAVNHFEWEHTISTASLPRGYEIQYREGDSQWQTLIDQKQTDQTYYDVPANTLPAGNLEWRVRTYNSNLTPGNWSDSASIIVRSAPPAPIITSVTSSPRPVISWQSEGQIQAEVRINDSTRSVLSAAKSYRWEDFLPDGFITVNVRVKNQFDLWSPWASAQTTIKNTPSGQITLSASVSNYAVSLSINSTYPQNYIYRDDVLIGKAVNREGVDTAFTYLDDTALGSHSYYAMGVDDQSNYQQSERITEKVSVPFGVIGELKALSWIELKRKRGSYPSHDIKRSYPVTMVYYSGNPLPVAYVSNELDASHTLEFTTDKTTADHLENLTGKTVIYKDVRGDLIIGVLVSVECSRDRATDVKLSIEETQREVVKIE
ncbi:hypothetical protein [Negativibacillus massiliensis]|uniref:hypothetical protein n=1 Tax=Negativibacillus massiliensis TaxID=1871035 RepID=UPI003AF20A15